MFVAKINPDDLNIVNYVTFSTPSANPLVRMLKDGNIGVVFTRITSSMREIVFLKLNSNLNLLTSLNYSSTGYDSVSSILATSDSGLAITGKTLVSGNFDKFLLKINKFGNVEFGRRFGGGFNDGGNVIKSAPDGRYLIAGFNNSISIGASDIFLTKTSFTGDVGECSMVHSFNSSNIGFQPMQVTDMSMSILGTEYTNYSIYPHMSGVVQQT